MTDNYPSMATLYNKLKAIGFDKEFVKKMLPDWWDRECETNPEGVIEGILYISRRLNLELNSLLDTNSTPKFKSSCQPKFKTSKNITEETLKLSSVLASRIAELAAYACNTKYQPIEDLTLIEIRQEILRNKTYIDLEGVLDFCFSKGIPVVHFNQLPKGAKKFEGMVTYFDNRPIIIISLNHKSTAKLLFIVLHELGHIHKQHIKDKCLVDTKIKLDSIDQEEIEANQVANQILFKDASFNYYQRTYTTLLTGEHLAKLAKNYSAQDLSISPESIVMNYSWHKAEDPRNENIKSIIWSTANKALKIVGENSHAPKIINNKLNDNLDWDKLSEDNQEYLELMTGLNAD